MKRLLPLVAALAVLSACGGGSTKPAATVTVTATPTAAAPSPSTSDPPVVSTPAVPADLKVGKGAKVGEQTVTVVKVDNSAPSFYTRKNHRWVGVEVRYCLSKDSEDAETQPSWTPWTLVGTDDESSYDPSSLLYNGMPTPNYPDEDKNVRSGECVKGWIIWEMPKTTKVGYIRYDNGTDPVQQWRF